MIINRHLYYRGHVQGVGFRYTVKQLATGYEVTGWVRNLADGRVEMLVRGEQAQVEEFLAAIAGSHLRMHIHEQQAGDLEAAFGTMTRFEIRR